MKTRHKILPALFSVFALFLAWACGVGMAQSNAGRNAEHNIMVNSVIILKEIDKGSPETAANWCKTFIVSGDKGRLSRDSVFASFLHYIRFHERPELTKSISDKVQEVKASYKPNIIDLKNDRISPTDTGFSVEIPVNQVANKP
ncbi:MAG: hypothetical protein RLZZ214_1967 [Verrucomicrobiota bacterium]|jgi:hypothetical protein